MANFTKMIKGNPVTSLYSEGEKSSEYINPIVVLSGDALNYEKIFQRNSNYSPLELLIYLQEKYPAEPRCDAVFQALEVPGISYL